MRKIVMRFSVTGVGIAGGHGSLVISVLPDEEEASKFFKAQRREMTEDYGDGKLVFIKGEGYYVGHNDDEQGLWLIDCPDHVVPGERVCVLMPYGTESVPSFDSQLEAALVYFSGLSEPSREENEFRYEDDLVTALASGETDIRLDDPEKGGFCWVVTPVEGVVPEDVAKFADGQRVLLAGDIAEGWVEERAAVIAYEGDGMYMVEVDGPRTLDDPDGLREVHERYISALEEGHGPGDRTHFNEA